jgi:hypothetical protein
MPHKDSTLIKPNLVKPTSKGRLGNKEMTLSEVKSWFLTKKMNFYNTGKGTDKEFCILANGFWQAEGYIGGIFRSEFNFYPICTAIQLLSEQSVIFLLRLDKSLSNKGTFNISLNNMGKFVIVYRLSGWNTFFSTFVPYFYMLYGAKYQAIHKLKKIYVLKNYIKKNSNDMYKVFLISIAYSLTAHSSRYKLSIQEKIVSLNLDPVLLKKVPSITIPENKVSPCFLFILGFFLGDGTLHLKLEWKQKNSTMVIVPLFNIVQSNVESNKQIMEIMNNTLNNMDIKTSLVKSTKTFSLTVKGINNVFKSLFPLLEKHSHFLFWKSDSFNLLVWVKKLVKLGGHHTYFGLFALIDKIYSNVNERITDKNVWISRLNLWLKAVSCRRDWGEYYIYPLYTPNKVIRGWQVRFPSTLKLYKSNKAMMCSTCGGVDKAFVLAVQYRDKSISDWIKTL